MDVKENNTGNNDTIVENNYTYNINEEPKEESNNTNNLVNSFQTIINFFKKIFKKK